MQKVHIPAALGEALWRRLHSPLHPCPQQLQQGGGEEVQLAGDLTVLVLQVLHHERPIVQHRQPVQEALSMQCMEL